MTHVSPGDLDRYLSGSMDGDMAAAVERHVSACALCRGLVDDRVVAAVRGIGDEIDTAGADHPEFEELAAYVDGDADRDAAAAIEAHLAACQACDAERQVLVAERDRIRALGPAGRRSLPSVRMAAAAALAIVAVGGWWWSQGRTVPVALEPAAPSASAVAPGSAVAVALVDRGQAIRVSQDGQVTGLSALGDVDREAVAAVALSARLPVPPDLATLRVAPDQLMGGGTARPIALSPMGIVVERDRPAFSWPQVPGATAYLVGVFDGMLRPVAESGPVTATTWTPAVPFQRGATYQWQVTAVTPSGPVVLPSAPAPVARFRVLDAAGVESLEAARRSGSRLALGILAARAGLVADAERELTLLAGENPGSAVVASLLAQVRTIRP